VEKAKAPAKGSRYPGKQKEKGRRKILQILDKNSIFSFCSYLAELFLKQVQVYTPINFKLKWKILS
jgi:hypothetical protein